MSERKNIDKLFQEKFKDFEMKPPENTWPELESRLKEKKNRKIIPFWWRLSGIAAALIIGFLILNQIGFSNKKDNSVNGVVIRENQQGSPEQNEKTILKRKAGDTEMAPENQNNNFKPENSNTSIASEALENKLPADEILKKSNNAIDKIHKQSNTVNSNVPKNKGSAVAIAVDNNDDLENKNDVGLNGNKSRKNAASKNIKQQPTVAGGYKNTKRDVIKNASDVNQNNKQNNSSDLENQNGAIAEKTNNKSQNNSAVADKNTTDVLNSETTVNKPLKQINDTKSDNKNTAIAASEKKSQNKKLDSAAIATVVPNALEELLNEKESKVTKEPNKLNRWQITSNIAPIYFGSTSGGSPIDSTFANNSKDYNTQVSYGIGASYAINKKFTLRTGINKVSLNYDTNDVALYAGFDSAGLDNVNTLEGNTFLNFGTRKPNSSPSTSTSADASAINPNLETNTFEGEVNQKMGYIEVPLEVSYAVIDTKFGVNVIAGVSTLFLNENSVAVVSDGLKTDLGEANNLNKTHFSTNVGLGLKYAFTKSLQANFEPIFKYQLNTFSRNSGDFKPYFFGLYTGLSFRF